MKIRKITALILSLIICMSLCQLDIAAVEKKILSR